MCIGNPVIELIDILPLAAAAFVVLVRDYLATAGQTTSTGAEAGEVGGHASAGQVVSSGAVSGTVAW